MKSILKAFSAVAIAGAIVLPAQAGTDQKDLKKVIEDQGINYVETAQKGITLSGYVDTSYTEQFAGSGQYGPAGTNIGGGPADAHAALHFNDNSNNTFNVNAVKIALEKALPDKNEWAAGFRIDTMYGSDAKTLGATDPTLGSAGSAVYLEQALVKFRIPVGNGLDIYMGKFVTFLGYEVIESPANLNFSRGLLFTNAIPLTHTGIYADYKFNDMFEAKFGIVDGWNNSSSSSVANTATVGNNNENSFGKALTGQFTVNAPGKNANVTQSFIYSPEGEPGLAGIVDNGPLVVYDIWGNWSPTFVKDSALLLGFNIDLGYNGASGQPAGGSATSAAGVPLGGFTPGRGGISDSNTWWGIALYSSYKFNKVFTLSGRAEYLHSDAALHPIYGPAGVVVAVPRSSPRAVDNPGQDDFSYTLTGTFNIWANLLTRIEYRLDDYTGESIVGVGTHGQAYGSRSNYVGNEISLNAVYSF